LPDAGTAGAPLAAGRIAGFGSSTRPEVRSIRIAS
jgi:hypothetical protein